MKESGCSECIERAKGRTAERARNYYLQYDSAKLIALPALLYGVRPFLESFSEFAHNEVSSIFELQVGHQTQGKKTSINI